LLAVFILQFALVSTAGVENILDHAVVFHVVLVTSVGKASVLFHETVLVAVVFLILFFIR